MTANLHIDGVTISDAAQRVSVDGVSAKVSVDGVTVYEYDPIDAPDISTSVAMPDGIQGAYYSWTPTNTGGVAASWAASGLPSGLSINSSTGVISGTPSGDGTFSVTVTATNVGGDGVFSDDFDVILPVTAPDITGSDAFDQAYGGEAFSWTPTNSGGPATSYFLQSGVLPNGLSLNPLTGEISGTPTTVQTQAITIRASNASGTSDFSGSIAVARNVIPGPTNLAHVASSGTVRITFGTTGGWTSFASASGNPSGNYTQPSGGDGALYEIKLETPVDVDGAGSYSYSPGFGVWSSLGTSRLFSQNTPGTPGEFYTTDTQVSIREIANPSNIATWTLRMTIVRN